MQFQLKRRKIKNTHFFGGGVVKLQTFDFGISWNWKPDREFIETITAECKKQGVSYYLVESFNLGETLEKLSLKKVFFKNFLDRASDTDEAFGRLTRLLKSQNCLMINDIDKAQRAVDKAVMHMELLSRGINVPFTIIVSDFGQDLNNLHVELSRFASPFIIKLAHEGGGTGVMLDARAFEDLLHARQQHGDGKYLLQERVHPVLLNGKRAWFRSYYAFGKIIPCWWDDITRVFDILTQNGMNFLGLNPLKDLTLRIAKICGLDFFSTEIALTNERKFVVVDYVNDQCDMRRKSMYYDGVPDNVIDEIAKLMIKHVLKNSKKESQPTQQ